MKNITDTRYRSERTCYSLLIKHVALKDQMTKFLLFQCNCNKLTELPKQIVLPKTASKSSNSLLSNVS